MKHLSFVVLALFALTGIALGGTGHPYDSWDATIVLNGTDSDEMTLPQFTGVREHLTFMIRILDYNHPDSNPGNHYDFASTTLTRNGDVLGSLVVDADYFRLKFPQQLFESGVFTTSQADLALWECETFRTLYDGIFNSVEFTIIVTSEPNSDPIQD